MHGEQVAEVRGRLGVRWVRAVTDLPTAIDEIRRKRLSLRDYLRSLRGPIEYAIFAGDDPLPALLEVPLISHIGWKRRKR